MIFQVSSGNADVMRSAWTLAAFPAARTAAHFPAASHAGWAGSAVAAVAAPRKRRPAAATFAFVNRGFV